MLIQILGTGCAKCHKLADNAAQAAKELGLDATVQKVTSIDEIMKFGVMVTPGLAVNGVVKSVGRVLSTEQIKPLLT